MGFGSGLGQVLFDFKDGLGGFARGWSRRGYSLLRLESQEGTNRRIQRILVDRCVRLSADVSGARDGCLLRDDRL